MNEEQRILEVGAVYRYSRPERPGERQLDGLPNFYWHTHTPDMPKAKLERGITRLPPVPLDDGAERVPAILLRSTPWKAGTPRTPWHDALDVGRGVLRYFGDNKVDEVTQTVKEHDPSDVSGNRSLLDAHWAQASDRPEERADSAPLFIFTGVPVGGRQKGNVRFDGLGIVERAAFVRQADVLTDLHFSNLLFEIRLLDLSEDGHRIDWAWISSRRGFASRTVADRRAPIAWSQWVRGGDGHTGLA